jgi:hypothetical protein
VVVVWSNDSVRSEWVINEANEGLQKGALVPVCIDDVRPPLAFRRRQTIRVVDSRTAGDDVVAAVRGVLEGGSVEIRGAVQRPRRMAPWIAAAVGLGLVIGAALMYGITRSAGEAVAYISRDADGSSVLVTRWLDDLTEVSLTGTEHAENPFFSPDGRWVGYFDGSLLKRVPAQGGAAATIASLTETQSFGASWGSDDDIVYARGEGFDRGSLWAVPFDAGRIAVTGPARVLAQGYGFEFPRFSNDGAYIGATLITERLRQSIWLYEVETGAARRMVEYGEGPLWSADDRSITFTQCCSTMSAARKRSPTCTCGSRAARRRSVSYREADSPTPRLATGGSPCAPGRGECWSAAFRT